MVHPRLPSQQYAKKGRKDQGVSETEVVYFSILPKFLKVFIKLEGLRIGVGRALLNLILAT
jgi:hypothetical protein